MAAKAPSSGWARLSAGIIYDPDWLRCGAPARLVFMTSIALAKSMQADGLVSMRAMVGIQYGALDPAEVEAAAAELVEVGLWLATEDRDVFRVRSYLKWNESTADQAEARDSKRRGAHISNHKQGYHAGKPVDGCPMCGPSSAPNAPATDQRTHQREQPQSVDNHAPDAPATLERTLQRDPVDNPPDAGVSPGGNAPNAIAVRQRAQERNASERQTETETETRRRRDETETRRDHHQPSADPRGEPADGGAVAVADRLLEQLGLIGAEARPDELSYVARALARGWTERALLDLAMEIGAKPDAEVDRSHRHVLLGALRRRANEDPPATVARLPATTGGTAPAPGSADWGAAWQRTGRLGSRMTLQELLDDGHDPVAARAAYEVRQVIKFESETTAKFAFRDAYLAATGAS